MVIVGGGVLGTMHAVAARRRGLEVVHLEREAEARGASVRNFGLVWVSGRRPAPSSPLRCGPASCGANSAPRCPASASGPRDRSRWPPRTPSSACSRKQPRCPTRNGAGSSCSTPRLSAWLIRRCAASSRAACSAASTRSSSRGRCCPRCAATSLARPTVASRARGHRDRAQRGSRSHRHLAPVRPGGPVHRGGAHRGGRPLSGPRRGAAVRRVRLQMMQTAPLAGRLTTALADGDSLRYYPAYDLPARSQLRPQAAAAGPGPRPAAAGSAG